MFLTLLKKHTLNQQQKTLKTLSYTFGNSINERTMLLTLSVMKTFSHASGADSFFENIVTKEVIAQNKQFLLLPQCFPHFVIGYPFNYIDFRFFDKICSKSSAAELSYEGKG